MAKLSSQRAGPRWYLAHNKTLARRLYQEFKKLFPIQCNREYSFVQPITTTISPSHIPAGDVYIRKARLSTRIRQAAVIGQTAIRYSSAAISIIIASVSCNLRLSGSPRPTTECFLILEKGQKIARRDHRASGCGSSTNAMKGLQARRVSRARLISFELFPTYDDSAISHRHVWATRFESLEQIDPLTGQVKQNLFTSAHLS